LATDDRPRRKLRAAFTVLGVVVIAVAVAAVPAILRAFGSGPASPQGLFPVHPSPAASGPAATVSRFRWSVWPSSPLGPRSGPVLIWTGRELVEIGGLTGTRARRDGAAFDPATGRWHRIARAPGVVGSAELASVWAGRALFVAGGRLARSGLSVRGAWAGLYDPAADRWTRTGLPRAMDGLYLTAAVWTGRTIVVAGADAATGRLGVADYDPAARRWRVITPSLPAGHPARTVDMVVTPRRLTLWSFWDQVRTFKNGFSDRAGVDVFAVGRQGSWHDVTGRWPQNVGFSNPVYAGHAILISPGSTWCGMRCSPPGRSGPGYFVDPATLARRPIPPGPLVEAGPGYIWTGRAILAVDLNTEISGPGSRHMVPGDMAAYDPVARQWLSLPSPPVHPTLSATPVWTGTELLELSDNAQLQAFHR
jgi:hypothetical protein